MSENAGFPQDPLTTPREYKENPMDRQFSPKNPVELNTPKHDLISPEELAACDGMSPARKDNKCSGVTYG